MIAVLQPPRFAMSTRAVGSRSGHRGMARATIHICQFDTCDEDAEVAAVGELQLCPLHRSLVAALGLDPSARK